MPRKSWFFAFFAASGFCSLVYEVIWLRVAMAQFGVTTALTSIVLSVFMAGLALGSWTAGRLVRNVSGPVALRAYGIIELFIGVSAFVVPVALESGHRMLAAGTGASWGSFGYHVASGAWICLAFLPFCMLMGATFPAAMAAFRSSPGAESEQSFSYLYVANVVGALAGTLTSAFLLIELLGFRNTARVAAVLNVAVAVTALILASDRSAWVERTAQSIATPPRTSASGGRGALWFLFATGLMSLAMEVVWIRQFTPYLGTVVYAFAAVLALYLAGTFLGSRAYRAWIARGSRGSDGVTAAAWACIGITALLPLAAADPRLPLSLGFLTGVLRLAVGIVPFCAAVGFLTPMLVDRWSCGDPARAGSAYALNVLGCIVGPLLAGFVLLPRIDEAWALALLAVPAAVTGILYGARTATFQSAPSPAPASRARGLGLAMAVLLASAFAVAGTRSFESRFSKRVVLRDDTATVMAVGSGFDRRLLVNGFSMTHLTPISKVMAHLPLASLAHPPTRGLVVCFGMGTSFRSMLTWGIPTTSVELVPSVPLLFPYYHDDAAELLRRPSAKVVIDDGRRFLERTAEQFDVITIDPPPPVEAACSSLLYSREFYEAAKKRLRPGGILQQWFPGGDMFLVVSFARTLSEVFPHVRIVGGLEGWGFHFLASDEPIPAVTAEQMAARLPAAAAADFVEWGPEENATAQFARLLSQEVPLETVLLADPDAPALVDDRPFNEYFLLRRAFIDPSPDGVKFPVGLERVDVEEPR